MEGMKESKQTDNLKLFGLRRRRAAAALAAVFASVMVFQATSVAYGDVTSNESSRANRGSDNSDPTVYDIGGPGGGPPGKGSGNAVTRYYPGVAAFGEFSIGKDTNRDYPKPLGTYLNEPVGKLTVLQRNERDYRKGGTYKSVFDEVTNQRITITNAPKECLNSNPVHVRDDNGNLLYTGPNGKPTTEAVTNGKRNPKLEEYNKPIGMKWINRISWAAGWKRVTGSKFYTQNCISAKEPYMTKYVCPISFHSPQAIGPFGKGVPAENRLTLTANLNGKPDSILTPFGKVHQKWRNDPTITGQEKFEQMKATCNDASATLSFTMPTGNVLSPEKAIGAYQVSAVKESVTCYTLLRTPALLRVNSTDNSVNRGSKGWEKKNRVWKDYNLKNEWYGCETPVETPVKRVTAWACDINDRRGKGNYGWFRPAPEGGWTNEKKADRPEIIKWTKDFDYGAAYDTCLPKPRIDCYFEPLNGNSVKISAGGNNAVLPNKPVLAANGKPVTLKWPEAQVVPVRDVYATSIKKTEMRYKISSNGAYPDGMTGKNNYDPVASSVNLQGAGTLGDLNSPLVLNFFKGARVGGPTDAASPVSGDVQVKPVIITGKPIPTYTVFTRLPIIDRNDPLKRTFILGEPTESEPRQFEDCPSMAAELYVTGSRNVN